MYVTTEQQLLELCEALKDAEMLALDTEFVREKTYFHRLGLIQVASDGVCAAIDPIAVPALDPFLDLIRKPDVLKVFHAGRQDLEILNRLAGEALKPIFDTQVAGALLGWGAQISFARIVMKATGKKIHKGETYTDWCRRPLSQSQIDYALDDARYLIPVYNKVLRQLKKYDRMSWVQGEFEPLENPDNFKLPDPRKQFLRVKSLRGLKPVSLAALRELAAWREEEAIRRDCLPKAVVRDESLLEIARKLPGKLDALAAIRGFHRKEVGKSGQAILEAIQRGKAVPEEAIPVLPDNEGHVTSRGVEELLSAFVQIRSEEMRIEPSILAQRKQVHDLVKCFDQKQDLEKHFLFQGWRREAIGTELLAFLNGERGLAIDQNGQVVTIPIHLPGSALA
ncbi:MAG: ribonuclease D [Nitrospinaceae bacterium]|nr:MAG: ribonuclease D [Nitrospinaceae bacterium]